MLRLIPAYLVFTAVVALAVGLLLWWLRRKFTDPLERLAHAVTYGTEIYPAAAPPELSTLEVYCADTRQALTQSQAENARLQTALGYARDAEENRKQLISNITHELKTPLAVIHSYAEGFRSDIPAEKREKYLQVIMEETERMDGMVMQMLELSRLEAGQVKLKVERFSLSRLIHRTAEKFQPMLEEKKLSLTLELDGEVEMEGDEGRMAQVITNYISNAVKYTPHCGKIVIRALAGRSGVFFNILNTAPHLSQTGLEKVYHSFYREDTARTEKSTGLGLAIVKQIVLLHGGECYVNNITLDGEPAVEFGFFPKD
jgi:signal transduction histidine kinase